MQNIILQAAWINTPLGPMYAIGDDEGLYLLKFSDKPSLKREVEDLRIKKKAIIVLKQTELLNSIKEELSLYFTGDLKKFKTPIHMLGSAFQQKVWTELIRVPYGETESYLNQAKAIGNHKAFRAVANANGANKLTIIIPCHRIINNNGQLGGYGSGLARKKWLIEHEQVFN